MKRFRFGPAIGSLHALALALWLGALMTAGIAAMNIFSRMPQLQVTLNDYPAVPQDEHGRLAAGMVMEGVFFTIDLVRFVAAPLAVITLAIEMLALRLWRTPSGVARLACIILAAGAFASYASMAPSMNRDLRQYWKAAELGDITAAGAAREQFQSRHVTANRLLQVELTLVLTAIAITGWTWTSRRNG